MKINCLSIAVDDLAKSTKFYDDWIGGIAKVEPDDDLTVIWFDDNSSLVLYGRKEIEAHTKRPSDSSPNEFIMTHFCKSTEEVDELLRSAVEAGATVTDPVTQHPWGYSVIFLDPDNHAWELNHNPNVPQ